MGVGFQSLSVDLSSTIIERIIEKIVYRDKDPRNPNSSCFTIVKVQQIGEAFVSWVRYPNCTNYEGNKILVSTFDPRKMKKLDPHFSTKSGLIARFVPTDEGWEMAIAFATNCYTFIGVGQ